MQQILFITGSDDKGRSRIFRENDDFTLNVVGVLPIDPQKLQSNSIAKQSKLLVLGVHTSLKLSASPDSIKVVNLIGDADGSIKSLKAVTRITHDLAFKDVINKPSDVFKTSRINLPRLLSNVENARIASARDAYFSDIDEIANFVRRSNISYPIIVRLSGFHNSAFIKKINSETDLERIKDWFNVSNQFLIIDYIANLHLNGFYRKARIAVIGGEFFPQHFLSSDVWCVGANSRYTTMMEHPLLRKDEQTFLESFATTILPKYKTALIEIHNRIGLDIYGIDCFLRDNGEIVIFEANPCMDLLSMWLGPNNEYQYKMPHRTAVREAIVQLLER